MALLPVPPAPPTLIEADASKPALAATEKFDNPSRAAAAVLKVAAAHARSGDHKTAAGIAARIKLSHRSEMLRELLATGKEFDYRRPETWGENYDANDFFTMASHFASIQKTANVAAAAMELALALEYKPAN